MPTNLSISLATLADADVIADMSRTEIEEGLPWGWTPDRVMRSIRRREVNVAVAKRKTKNVIGFGKEALLGFGVMSYRDIDAHLILFAVHREHRRAGIGSAILKWLEEVALNAGIARIQAEVRADNDPARAFYQMHQYKEVDTVVGMYHGYEDGVRLLKTLIERVQIPEVGL